MSRDTCRIPEQSEEGVIQEIRATGTGGGLDPQRRIWFWHPRFWDDPAVSVTDRFAANALTAAARDGWEVFWVAPGQSRLFWGEPSSGFVRRDPVTGIWRVVLGGRWLFPIISRVFWRKLTARMNLNQRTVFMWAVESVWHMPLPARTMRSIPLVSRPLRSLKNLPGQGPVIALTRVAGEHLLQLGLTKNRLVRSYDTDATQSGNTIFPALLDILRQSPDNRSA